MKAIRYHGPKLPLQLEEIARPIPGPGEVLVKVKASGICHTDLHFISGLLNLGIAPLTLGHEIAGVIDAVGPGVDESIHRRRVLVYYYAGCGQCLHCLRGDENLCDNLRAENGFITDGGFAEYIKIPARNAVALPDNITDEMAAPIGCSVTTAVHAARLADVHYGEYIIVYGIGGVGYGLVQLSNLAGATVIAVGRTDAKLRLAEELGAKYTINSAKENPTSRVQEITNGRGADVIYELVGTTETMNNSMQSLGKRGRLIFIGYSPDSFVVHPILLVIKEAKVIGSVGNTLGEMHEAVRLVGQGKIKTVVDHTIKLDDFQQGIDALSAGKAIGRIVIKP